MIRYGIAWPDGSETGPLADHARDCRLYARQHNGTVIQYENQKRSAAQVPEVDNEKEPADTFKLA